MSPLASLRSSKATVLWIGTQRKQFNVGAYVAETYRSRFAWITGLLCWLLVSAITATAHVSPEHRKLVVCECCLDFFVEGSLGLRRETRYACVEANLTCHGSCQSNVACFVVDNNEQGGGHWTHWTEVCGVVSVTKTICLFDERYARVTLNWVCGTHAPRQSPILCQMTDADCDKRCPEAPPGCGRTLKVQVQSSSDRVIGI